MGQSPDGRTYSDKPSDYILIQGNADLVDGWVKPRVWTTQKTKTADIGDLIMSVRAPAGSMGKTAYNAVIGRGVAAIKGSEYFFQILSKMDADGYWKKIAVGSTFESINSDAIRNAIIKLPSKAEQEKIGQYFSSLDTLLTLHQRKLDQLKTIKKALLEKMFPKNGKSVPDIRFKGFTDAWEQHNLSDFMADFIVPMRDKPREFSGSIPWTRIEDIEGKYLNGSLSGQYVSFETIKNMNLKIIPKNSLIVSSSASFGVVAIITQDLITNQTFIGLVPKEEKDLDFWYTFFHSSSARKYMELQSVGSTIFYIAREKFVTMPVIIPLKEEMKKIGIFYSSLDSLLTLHQRKLDLLKNIKKSLLQKMFV